MRAKIMETRIVEELREITGNPHLFARDVMEWNASRSAVRLSVKPDEVMIECPKAGVWAAVTKRAAEVCSRCGCTQDRACEGGCYWIETREGEPKVCSACFHGTPDMFAGGLLDLVDGAR